jgi:hypothetical protein
MTSKPREGIRQRPWQESWHVHIVPLLSLGVLQQLEAALEDEPTPEHALVLREVQRALEHATWTIADERRGGPAKGGWSHG